MRMKSRLCLTMLMRLPKPQVQRLMRKLLQSSQQDQSLTSLSESATTEKTALIPSEINSTKI